MIKNILIGTVLVLLTMASAGATNGATVAVDPPSQTVAAGAAFHVNITVEDVTNMRADQAVLNFNPGVMYVTDIIEGDFLKAGGSTIDASGWNNPAGKAWISYSLYGTWTAVSGSGTLATIEFKTYPGAPPGTYDMSLTDVILIDANNEEIPTDVVDGTVTIPPMIPPVSVPVLSGIGMIVLIGMLSIVLAISVTKRERK